MCCMICLFIFVILLLLYILTSLFLPPLLCKQYIAEDAANMEMPKTKGERVRLIDDNEEALFWRIALISNAQKKVILTTFELRDDAAGQDIMSALLAAAERGVQIKVLIDGVDAEIVLRGSVNFKSFLCHKNIEVKYYNPFLFSALWKINYRLHEKYLIVDDTVFILGGRNTHNVYLGKETEKSQSDRDILIYITNKNHESSLNKLKVHFETLWGMDECLLLSGNMDSRKYKGIQEELLAHWQKVQTRYGNGSLNPDLYAMTMEVNGIWLLTGNSGVGNKKPIIWKQLCGLMKSGKREVLIQTPFVMCDTWMYSELAEVCRRVDSVGLITNSYENIVNPLGSDYPNQRRKLEQIKATVYEYSGSVPMHTKTVLIDDNLSIIGSFNMDNRSTYIDTEIMLVIDCRELNAGLRQQIINLQEQSVWIAPDGKVTYGTAYREKGIPVEKRFLYGILRVLLYPFEYLL